MTNSGISYIDIAIVAILAFFIFRGFKRGFTEELMRFLGISIGLAIAIKFMDTVSINLVKHVNLPPVTAMITSFSSLFLGTIFLFKFFSKHIKKIFSFSVLLGGADKAVGGAIGFAKGAIIVSLITILISIFNFSDVIKSHVSHSQLFNPMRQVAPFAYSIFKVIIPHSEGFITELEENFSGISTDKRGAGINALIEHYKN